jgi:AcrR family transcriptional regulator
MKAKDTKRTAAGTRQAKTGRSAGPRRRRKRAEAKEQTRKRILRAALELFSKKGFDQTTAKQISDRAGIAEGTLFNYFKTKEDVALCFFEEELAAIIDWYWKEEALHGRPLPEKLFAIIFQHLERLTPYEKFIGAVYLKMFQPVSRLNALALETQERTLRYLRFIKDVILASGEERLLSGLGDFAAYGFGMFHFAILTYWLQDSSRGKESTLALLDRSLKIAEGILKRRAAKW